MNTDTHSLVRSLSISNLRSTSPVPDEFDLINKDSLRAINVAEGLRRSKKQSSITLSSSLSPRNLNDHPLTLIHPSVNTTSTPLSASVTTRVQHALNLRSQMSPGTSINHPTIVSSLAASGSNAFRIVAESTEAVSSEPSASKRLAKLLQSLHSESESLLFDFDLGKDRTSTVQIDDMGKYKDVIDNVLGVVPSTKRRIPPPRRPLSPVPKLPSLLLPSSSPPILSSVFESAIQAEYPFPLNKDELSPNLKRMTPSKLSSTLDSVSSMTEFYGSGIKLFSGNTVDALVQSIGSTHNILLDKLNTSNTKAKRVPPPPPPPPTPLSSSSSFLSSSSQQYSLNSESVSKEYSSSGVHGYLTGNVNPISNFEPLSKEEIDLIEKAALKAAEDEERRKLIEDLSTRNASERTTAKENLKRLHKLNAKSAMICRIPYL